MATIFFIIFHFIAIIFGFWLLLISIPLHIFYSMSKSNAKDISKNIQEQTEVLKKQQDEIKDISKSEESSRNDSSLADELNKLAKLKESGVLTEEEFRLQKEKLLK